MIEPCCSSDSPTPGPRSGATRSRLAKRDLIVGVLRELGPAGDPQDADDLETVVVVPHRVAAAAAYGGGGRSLDDLPDAGARAPR